MEKEKEGNEEEDKKEEENEEFNWSGSVLDAETWLASVWSFDSSQQWVPHTWFHQIIKLFTNGSPLLRRAVMFKNQKVLYVSHEGLLGHYSGKNRDEEMHTKWKELKITKYNPDDISNKE